MNVLGIIVFVIAGGLVYLLAQMLPLGKSQRRFCIFITFTALFLGACFGQYARDAIIAILVLGMGGLLTLDRTDRERRSR